MGDRVGHEATRNYSWTMALQKNTEVHDAVSGVTASLRKEEIQMEIEMQQELGEDRLL